jgi:hypothetical protein
VAFTPKVAITSIANINFFIFECLAGNAIDCAKTVDDVIDDF